MKLTETQLAEYKTNGFVVLPSLFSEEEVKKMKSELRRIQTIDTDHLVREKNGGIAKTIYKVHDPESPTISPAFQTAVKCGLNRPWFPRHSPSSGNSVSHILLETAA
jgi:ectoine hydroxylase